MGRNNHTQYLGDLPEDIDRETYRGDTTGYGGPQGRVGPNNLSPAKPNRLGMTNRAYNLTDTSRRLIPENQLRKYLIIVNTGLNTVFVSFGNSSNVTNSVPIVPGGNYEPWYAPYSAVYGLVGSGLSGTIVVVEGLMET